MSIFVAQFSVFSTDCVVFKIIFYDSRYIDIDHKKNLDEQYIFIIEISATIRRSTSLRTEICKCGNDNLNLTFGTLTRPLDESPLLQEGVGALVEFLLGLVL